MEMLLLLVLPLICSFVLAYILGKGLIPILHRMKYGQSIREEGPQSHFKKQGTPTMGGLIFILATTVVTILYSVFFAETSDGEEFIALSIFLAFGFIGFLDDYLKILRKNNLGLRAYQKMFFLILITLGIYLVTKDYEDLKVIYIPFLNGYINLSYFYVPFLFIYFTGVTNAVNLTDGLDGLATTVTIIVLLFLFVIGFMFGKIHLSVFAFILVGALMAFLIFNINPAKVFMGDTGSLALGGAVAAIAFILKIEFVLVFVGIIYVIETLSVIIQVLVYKCTKKRVFKMAPIHHHFEHLGWSENKIVCVFGAITLIACILSWIVL
ncbi:phospho-N-acetylmuramoyl-pentapeptide-transferase [Candidatus Arthromitus sp. SFB-rat-Yit]|uniref:phospho-N-acetylmuramoyl-pentapeptide- transferase n=1 Tax=Candidatus Arthromitus sp. SFB-rat-Yit TaxID=1041504 RepID=UPI000227A0FD|nr:phospho-N-acetylmuramoyl-pentapeptide-transferase [Candidatus Arthromitus sp. SFB-rat-Yit]BAK81319.1 phospho-N-acetylmuramoyl-pentapeptide-transferase [Candidatus Arthromitus sp. SFB-rat-Yit]